MRNKLGLKQIPIVCNPRGILALISTKFRGVFFTLFKCTLFISFDQFNWNLCFIWKPFQGSFDQLIHLLLSFSALLIFCFWSSLFVLSSSALLISCFIFCYFFFLLLFWSVAFNLHCLVCCADFSVEMKPQLWFIVFHLMEIVKAGLAF